MFFSGLYLWLLSDHFAFTCLYSRKSKYRNVVVSTYPLIIVVIVSIRSIRRYVMSYAGGYILLRTRYYLPTSSKYAHFIHDGLDSLKLTVKPFVSSFSSIFEQK